MLLYDFINTEEDLIEFVKKLNELSHFEKYQLFNYVFSTKLLQLRADGYKNTPEEFYEKWTIPIGNLSMFSTTKINKKNHSKNPDFKTGLYEKIYFHLQPDDLGISQK